MCMYGNTERICMNFNRKSGVACILILEKCRNEKSMPSDIVRILLQHDSRRDSHGGGNRKGWYIVTARGLVFTRPNCPVN